MVGFSERYTISTRHIGAIRMPLSALVLLLDVSFRYLEPYDNDKEGRLGSRRRFMITNRGGFGNISNTSGQLARGWQACMAPHPTMSVVDMRKDLPRGLRCCLSKSKDVRTEIKKAINDRISWRHGKSSDKMMQLNASAKTTKGNGSPSAMNGILWISCVFSTATGCKYPLTLVLRSPSS